MEWVVVTAKTVDAAKELALDQLGVAVDDAEFEVLEEPRQGLFGRVRGEARVRARVRPAAVRPKRDRRERPKRERRGPGESTGTTSVATVAEADAEITAGSTEVPIGDATPRPERKRRPKPERSEHRPDHDQPVQEKQMNAESTVDPAEVGAAAAAFVTGLAEAFGAPAEAEVVAEGTELEVRLSGDGLGLLIGPGGRTLTAIQDLARVAAQRRLGDHDTRLKIDVAGYREKRRVALEKFAHTVAAEVVANGRPKALEPMSSADRKIVHDALNEIDGVTSRSDGEDPARRVVISPA